MTDYVVEGPGFSLTADGTIRFFDEAGRVEPRPTGGTDWLITISPIDEGEEPVWWPVIAEDLRPMIRRLLATTSPVRRVEMIHVSPRFACIFWLQGLLGMRNLEGARTVQCQRVHLSDTIEVDGRHFEVVVDKMLGSERWMYGYSKDGERVAAVPA